jgi:prepilin-type N-terminal cleavage/methylation domain-containing protein
MDSHKIKSFTLLEVAITMLIAAILLGITYTSYSIVVKSYRSFIAKNDNTTVLISLDHVLRRDFAKATVVIKDADGIELQTDQQLIKYAFNPDFIIRSSTRPDTFKVQTQDVITAFENLPLGDVQDTPEQNRLDELSFTLLFQNEKIPYHYRKQYSSENLIQRNPNAVN